MAGDVEFTRCHCFIPAKETQRTSSNIEYLVLHAACPGSDWTPCMTTTLHLGRIDHTKPSWAASIVRLRVSAARSCDSVQDGAMLVAACPMERERINTYWHAQDYLVAPRCVGLAGRTSAAPTSPSTRQAMARHQGVRSTTQRSHQYLGSHKRPSGY